MTTHRRLLSIVTVCLALAWVVGVGAAAADETCNSPYISKLIKGQEDFIYVWALGVEGVGDGFDKLVTIDGVGSIDEVQRRALAALGR